MKFKLLFALIFLGQIAFSQEQKITGLVTDNEGIPLPGVTVLVINSDNGTTTDFDGMYSITASKGQVLQYSYIGFTTQQITVGDQTQINVTFKADNELETVVVTALGVTRSKKSLGFAQQSVVGEQLNSTLETDLNTALAGKVSGIQAVGNSGATFNNALIRLRGDSNILYVVDGIKIQNASDINTADVENISVLKGGAATALYGFEARGGVVIITSKKAKNGQTSIAVQQSVELATVTNLPEYQNEYGGGYSQDFITTPDGQLRPDYGADQSWGPRLDGTLVRHWDSWIEGDPEFGQLRPWVASPNNVKNFYETANINKTIVNFMKGGDNYNISSTVRYVNQEGILPNSNRESTQISLNAEYNVTKKFKIIANGNYQIRQTKNNPQLGYTGSGSFFRPNLWWQRQLDIDRLRNYKRNGQFVSWNIQSPTNPAPAFWDSPFFEFFENRSIQKKNAVFGKLAGSYEFNDNLSATLEFRRSFNNFKFDRITAFGGVNDPGFTESSESDIRTEVFGIVNFNQKFGQSEQIDFSASAGFQTQNNTEEIIFARTQGGLTTPGFYNIETSVGRPIYTNTKLNTKNKSIFGTATIGYDDLIYLDGSIRSDWDSRANPDDNRLITYGLSTSFIFSNLIDNTDILSFGKLRAGYSRAPQFPGAYQIFERYENTDDRVSINGVPLLGIPNTSINPNLKGASTSNSEVGLELSFLQNRLGLDVTYFNIVQEDFPQDVRLPASTGSIFIQRNFGKETRSGFEVNLKATPVKTENFQWDTSVNFATLKWVIDEVDPNDDPSVPTVRFIDDIYNFNGGFLNLRDIEGKEAGGIYGSKIARDAQGRIIIDQSVTSDWTRGAIVREEDQFLGNFLPDVTGGFVNTVKYKGFELTASIDFQIGGNFYSTTKKWLRGSGLGAETVGTNDNGVSVRDAIADGGGYRVDGVDSVTGEPVTRYFSADAYNSVQIPAIDESLVFDASYAKLRQVSLGYNLPKNWYESIGIEKIKTSVFANNVWLIYSDTEIDPTEIEDVDGASSSTVGLPGSGRRWAEGAQFPSARTIGLNVSLTF